MPGSHAVVLRLSSCVLIAAAACGDDPVGVPDAPRVIDAAPPPIDAVVDACAPPTGPGTDHANALAADELWTEADSPHRITTQVGVPAGVTLRLAPCAVVELGPDAALTVSGSLLAEGEATRRVRIRAASSGQPWRWIDVSGGALSLTHTRIEGGGAPGAGGGVTGAGHGPGPWRWQPARAGAGERRRGRPGRVGLDRDDPGQRGPLLPRRRRPADHRQRPRAAGARPERGWRRADRHLRGQRPRRPSSCRGWPSA
jgi:hypothetical protein